MEMDVVKGSLASPSALPRGQLEELLREGVPGAKERERTTFDKLTAPFGDALVLFGAGAVGRRTLAGLRRIGINPLAFTDNNQRLWNQAVEGLQVLPPEEAAKLYGARASFVVAIWKGEGSDRMRDRVQQLKALGCERVTTLGPLYWKYPQVFLPYYAADLAHKVHEQADAVRQAYELWTDDASRREYVAQVRWRLLFDFDTLSDPASDPIYFPGPPYGPGDDEVFVDCGAYDGDTLRSFLKRTNGQFRRIFLFEPDLINFRKLQIEVSQLPAQVRRSISAHNAAVGARRQKVRFSPTGTGASSVGAGDVEIDCVALDDALEGVGPTYIKMDIEGYELEALEGARRSIATHAPVLAVCSYHCQDHLWQIPLRIHTANSNYGFFLRPHLMEGWDLVCYAAPKPRLECFEHRP